MTRRDVLKDELGNKERSVGYYAVKYTVFLAPPMGIFLAFYFLLHDLFWAVLGTILVLVVGVSIIAYWYMKKIRGDDTLDE